MNPLFTGCATALITPIRDGQVDEAALHSLLDFQLENGIDGIVAIGGRVGSVTLGGRVGGVAVCGRVGGSVLRRVVVHRRAVHDDHPVRQGQVGHVGPVDEVDRVLQLGVGVAIIEGQLLRFDGVRAVGSLGQRGQRRHQRQAEQCQPADQLLHGGTPFTIELIVLYYQPRNCAIPELNNKTLSICSGAYKY